MSGSLLTKISKKQSKKVSDTATGTTKTTAEIVLIGPFGPSVIVIGDPDYGDPHKLYGLLGHNYPKERDDDIEPLFVIEPDDPRKSVRVTVMTTVPFDKLCLLSNERNEQLEKWAHDEIELRSKEALEDYEV